MKTKRSLLRKILSGIISFVFSVSMLFAQQQTIWTKIPLDTTNGGLKNILSLYTAPDSTVYAMTTNESSDRFFLIPLPMAQRLAYLNAAGTAWLPITLPMNIKAISSVQQSSTGTLYVIGYSNELTTNNYPVLLRTADKGKTWQTSFIAMTSATSEIACSSLGELYVSVNTIRQTFFTTASILSSTDGGNSWSVVFSQSTTSTWYRLQAIHDRILFTSEDPQCNFQDVKPGFGGEIFQSRNKGKTWTRALVDQAQVFDYCFNRSIRTFIVDNNNEKITAFHVRREAFTSLDGLSWQKSDKRVNFAEISNIINHLTSGEIFTVPSGSSVLRRLNRYSRDLMPLPDIAFTGVDSLFFPATIAFGKNNRLYMGGFNTGSAYSIDLSVVPTSVSNDQATTQVDITISPNPTTDAASILLSLPAPSSVRLTLHDALGREVQTVAHAVYPSGRQDFTLSLSELASGIYFLRCSLGGQVVVRRLAVIR